MNRTKLIYRAFYANAFFLILVGIAILLSKIWTYYHSGADMDIYDKGSVLFEKPSSEITWLPDDKNAFADINPYLRKDIENAYAKSWQVKNLSQLNQKDLGLKEHFTEKLQAKFLEEKTSENHVESKVLSHNLQLHFLSFDKQIVSFSDLGCIQSHQITIDNKKYMTQDTSDYKVVMQLNDGVWRIKYLHRK